MVVWWASNIYRAYLLASSWARRDWRPAPRVPVTLTPASVVSSTFHPPPQQSWTRTFVSWLKAPTSTFTFKTLLYSKLNEQCKDHKDS